MTMLTELVVLLDTGGPLLIDVAVKGLIVVTAAAVMTLVMRRNSAASRHLVWTIAAVGLISLPVLAVTLPVWLVPVPELMHSLFQSSGNDSVVHSPAVLVPLEAQVHESERVSTCSAVAGRECGLSRVETLSTRARYPGDWSVDGDGDAECSCAC